MTFAGDVGFDGVTFAGNAGFDEVTFTGDAWFDGASFAGDARFGGASFAGDVGFDGVTFAGNAWFGGASFAGNAGFDEVTFTDEAWFCQAAFAGDADFYQAAFAGDAEFDGATFTRHARFDKATFTGNARFHATFTSDAQFSGARFESASQLGPLGCGGTLDLDGVVFAAPVTLEVAARTVSLKGARWASKAALRLRYAELDLSDAVLEYPVMVTAHPTRFPLFADRTTLEWELIGLDDGVRLASVSGVDSAFLALHDIDLSGCRFAGAVHLDQLRVDGWCTFATAPAGWDRRFPWRWSRRRTLAEEHDWRARSGRRSHGWTFPSQGAPTLRPAVLAALYRQMRKSLEDGKNEPGAADFYFGECEMRRHDKDNTFRAERVLLTGYWALSGYGLRASRALAWLGVAMTATMLVLMLWGLPTDDPKPQTTGRQVEAGHDLTLTTDTPDPQNPTGALADRMTTERFEKSLRVVINSVVFRSSGQNLTTTGTYTEMVSRVTEPVLLGFAVIAIRNRVKR
ncbi:pentapeptide repeat-containing protein [Streptomyces niveus]|uniref:pentapeptide repeat-containing protein n=1 Tax=Streptomyces niveus TaxID=193462 RepID=UPI0036AC478A